MLNGGPPVDTDVSGGRPVPGKEVGREGDPGALLRLILQSAWHPESLDEARALAARSCLDRDVLLKTARQGGLSPLLYHRAAGLDLVSPGVQAELEQDYYQTVRANILLFEALQEALHQLKACGVPVIVLKGGALALTVYANMGLRPMVDVDLLVPPESVGRALRGLAALGYEGGPPLESAADFDVSEIHSNQLLLRRRDGAARGSYLEIHWQLFWFPYYRQVVPADWFWQTRQPLTVGTAEADMLGPEGQLLHLCAHLIHHHGTRGPFRPLWLYDVAAVIGHYGGQIDWDELLARAKACRLVLPLQRVLTRVSDEWHPPIPAAILRRLQAMRPSREETRALEWLTETSHEMTRYALASLAALPDWPSRLRFLWRELLFPSAAFMRGRYGIQHRVLLPLYYPYRWLMGLWAAARR